MFGETRPASTLVEVSALVIPGARIEVEAVALVLVSTLVDPYNAGITWLDEPLQERTDGPLAGRTLLVKDLIDTAGIRTTYGSRLYADHVPERHATVVQRVLDAGAADRRQGEPRRVRVGRARVERVVRDGAQPGPPGSHDRRLLERERRRARRGASASSASAPTPAAPSACPRPRASSSG